MPNGHEKKEASNHVRDHFDHVVRNIDHQLYMNSHEECVTYC